MVATEAEAMATTNKVFWDADGTAKDKQPQTGDEQICPSRSVEG